jgi:enamine deaminase RidA (YjgF/YER057c/UK114 family)
MRTLIPVSLVVCLSGVTSAADIERIESSKRTGTSQAVVVGNVALVHTAQLLPLDARGRLVGKGKATPQIEQVLDNLVIALKAGQSDLDQVVKLNVYAARQEVVPLVEKALAKRFASAGPAVCAVVGVLSHPDALVSMDAVAVVQRFEKKSPLTVHAEGLAEVRGGSHLAILPPGPVVYVAGQAEKGATLAEATRKTLASLRATLKFMDLDSSHIVQVKSFVHPMTKLDEARKEMTGFFGKKTVPPLVFVEWTAANSIEIELIAAAPAPRGRPIETVDYLTPPGMKASPIFSRVSRINHGKRIYVSGLYGKGDDGAGQVKDVFATLGGLLKKTGSDFRHLVKATYYVSSDDASNQLNLLRPKYYDARRPPSASKAPVAGTGRKGRSITLDMIAVTVP